MQSLVVDGTTAYVIQGDGLTVLDVSVPAAPALIGQMALIHDARRLAVADSTLYVINLYRLQIIDVRNPARPIEIARYTPHQAQLDAIQVSGGFVYLNSVEIVDVHTPAHPQYVATYAHALATDFLVAGDVAYVEEGTNVLTIVDLSDPAALTTVGTFTLTSPVPTYFSNLAVQGQRLYISAYTDEAWGIRHPRLITLDISQPTAPVLLGNVQIASYETIFFGNVGYSVDLNGLNILDISDPAHPVTRGKYPGRIAYNRGHYDVVQVIGGRMYFVDNSDTLKILDAANLDTAVVLGSYSTPPGLTYPSRIQIVGDTAYVLSYGLQVLDITNPISPTLRGYYASEFALTLQVAGVHAYLGRSSGELELLDISNPDQPTLLSTITSGLVAGVVEAGSRAYILTATLQPCGKFCTTADYTLKIMDISNPAVPQLINQTRLSDNTSRSTGAIVLHGGYLYATWSDGLRIIDVSNPTAPFVRASLPIAGGINGIQLVGDLAYLVSYTGLRIISVADPLQPLLLGRNEAVRDYAYSFQVQGTLAFIGDSLGVRVVDISDPRRPIARASYGDVLGPVQAKGDTLYVAGYTAGLYILRLHPDRFPAPVFVPLTKH